MQSYLRGAAGGVAALRVGVHDQGGEVVRHGGVAQVVGDLYLCMYVCVCVFFEVGGG